MKKFYVYIHTCPNGKKYVGLTTTDLKDRWKRGNGYKSNKHFYRAIQKYGWNNIEHQVFEVDTENEMYYLEKYLIAYYQTNKNEFGYNKSSGGEYVIGYHHSEETKKKISEAGKGNQYRKGKPHSEEIKKKISESHKGVKKGPHSEETKKKMSESLKGRIAPNKGIPCSKEKRRKISESLKGFHHSEETKNKLKGRAPWNKGKSLSDEIKKKISEAKKKKKELV